MILKDRVRLFLAKILRRKTVLFSRKPEWELGIKKKLKRFVVFFYEFDQVKLSNFETIIPLTLTAQKYLNDNSASSSQALIPSDACVRLCNDKLSFNKFLLKNNLSDYLPNISTENTYPYILKNRVGEWGDDIYVIQNSKDESIHKEKICSRNYFKQQFIPGNTEYTAHIIAQNKSIVFFKVLKFFFDEKNHVKGRCCEPMNTTEVNHDKFLNDFENILSLMNYQGICCFNYKILDGKPKIFEINPRFGGTMPYFIDQGIHSYIKATSRA